MSSPAVPDLPEDSRDARRLIPLFVAIVLVEVASVVALYWFGRHFGSS